MQHDYLHISKILYFVITLELDIKEMVIGGINPLNNN